MPHSGPEEECLTPTNRAAEEAINEFEEKTGIHIIDGPSVHFGEPSDIWYFAYGSNMCDEVFRVRRMVHAAESVPARLPGYRLAFTLPALPYREPAMASVEPVPPEELSAAAGGAAAEDGAKADGSSDDRGDSDSPADDNSTRDSSPTADGPDSATTAYTTKTTSPPLPKSHSRTFTCKTSNSVCVHGVAHRVTATQWAYICETEGGAGCDDADYSIAKVTIEAYDGRKLQAFTLITSPRTLHFNNGRRILPSKRYAGLLLHGARQHGLDPGYLEYLETMPIYVARTRGQRMGALMFSALSMMLVTFFALMRAKRKLLGYRPDPERKRRPFLATVFHFIARQSWRAHDILQPILGSGAE